MRYSHGVAAVRRLIREASCGAHRRAVRTLLLSLVLAGLALAVPAVVAVAPAMAADFTGGPTDFPAYVANDHTPSALRFSAAGLAPGTYYVEIRLSPLGAAPGTDDRGSTWNADSGAWANQGDPWSQFPTVTTTAGGSIASDPFFFKLADVTKGGSSSATYDLVVTLQPVGSGTARDGSVKPAVSVLDMNGVLAGSTPGFWVHDGIRGAQADARVEADKAGALSPVWALGVTGPTGITEAGTPGAAGSFRLALPVSAAFDVRVGGAVWPASATSFTGALADTDIALGASDTTPPTAPSTLTVAPRDGYNVLNWGIATDDTGVTSYTVYRWTDPPAGAAYTAQPVAVRTVPVTGLTDGGLTDGVTYHYFVRANDAATNVGPRSATASATPDGTIPHDVIAFHATAGIRSVSLSWTPPTDPDLAGVRILRKEGTSPGGALDSSATVVYEGTATTFVDTDVVVGTHYYYVAFAYDQALNYSSSETAPGADAIPLAAADVPVVTLTADAATVAWNGQTKIHGTLTDSSSAVLDGLPVKLERSTPTGWAFVNMVLTGTNGTVTFTTPKLATATQFRLSVDAIAGYTAASSQPVTVTPRVALGTPVAPASARAKARFKVTGTLSPRQTAGGHSVVVLCQLKRGSVWVLKSTVTATNVTKGSATVYSASVSLPSRGSWRLVASFAATAQYAATTSHARTLTIR